MGAQHTSAAPSRDELDAARARLLELEAEFELVVERYNLVEEELTEIEGEMATLGLDIDALETRLGVRQHAAAALAAELYKSGGGSESLAAVLTASSLQDAERRLAYLGESRVAQVEVFDRLDSDRGLLEKKLAQLDDAKARSLASRARLDSLRDEVETRLEQQREEVASLIELIERAERRREARAAAVEAAEAAEALFAPPGNAPAAGTDGATAARAALTQLGDPYEWAAEGPDTWDCSGLTMWAWAQVGVVLPHNSGAQFAATARVARSDWAPGDLLFFGSPIHHVGMYIGDGQMVEAPYTGSHVRVVSASRPDYVGAGRPAP